MPTRRPYSTSRDGSLAIDSISGAPRISPFIQPPLNSSSVPPLLRRKSDSALAAAAASPRTKVIAVGPSRNAFSGSAPALSAARSRERVLDDPEARVGVAQRAAQLGGLRHGDAAVVDGEDGLRLG